jgi:DNA-binding winged helix-turn-helix (wHTH) protein
MSSLFAIFGECNLDAKSHVLNRAGKVIHLTPKAFELLVLLLERRPAVVSKQEIMDCLWPQTFVSEANVPNLVAEIREAIGDSVEQPRFIRTVHRVGYSFHGSASVVMDETGMVSGVSRFFLVIDGREMALNDGDNIIGRGEDCQVLVNTPTVSRRHARIKIASGVALISDLGSKNGTLVGGVALRGIARLKDGDEVQVGEVKMDFRVFDRARPTKTYSYPAPDGNSTAKRPSRPDTNS